MRKLKILFLGASRLVGLLERFLVSGKAENADPKLLSVEDSSRWHAVAAAKLCEVVSGPPFISQEFRPFLLDLVASRVVNMVIPSIDTATIGLSQLREELSQLGVQAVVSSRDLCERMYDKKLAEDFFVKSEIRTPVGKSYPLIAKPRLGSGSRGQFVFQDEGEYQFWSGRHQEQEFIVQPYVTGAEYTVDAYVDRNGNTVGAISRIRIVVSGGESMVTQSQYNERVLDLAHQVLKQRGWRGPITVQVIDTGNEAYLIEVNPRTGSGVPCSIEAGLDVPRWIIREYLGLPIPAGPIKWRSGLCMTRARKDYFLWLS